MPRSTAAIVGGLAVSVVLSTLVSCSSSTPKPASHPATVTSPAAAGVSDLPSVQRDGFTYRVPNPLPAGHPGDLVAVTAAGPDSAVHAGQRWVVLYHSTDVAGHDIAISGQVVIPTGSAPAGGWPVVSWAHGTTGIADRCSPSETTNFFDNENAQEVRTFVDAGYAVAATDYAGLGTPGVHPYLIGDSEGNAVVDIVTAAHHLGPKLSGNWFAVGHSQGGQAVLFATRHAAERAPQLHLRATVSLAPASVLNAVLPAVIIGGALDDQAYAVFALIGLNTVDPTVDLHQLLKPAALSRLDITLTSGCENEADAAFRQVPTDQLFNIPAARMDQLNAMLDRYGNPDYQVTHGPVLLVQGTTDTDVPPGTTAHLLTALKAKGGDVTEKILPGLNHDGIVGPSECDQLAWFASHGGLVVHHCVAHTTDPT